MSIIKKSPSDVLVFELVKGLMQQGVADEDVIASMAKAGVPDDMARSMVLRATEELETTGIKTSKSVVQGEIDSSLFEWGRGFDAKIDEKLDSFSDELAGIRARFDKRGVSGEGLQKEVEIIKNNLKGLNSSVKSFEVLAKEILKELKKK